MMDISMSSVTGSIADPSSSRARPKPQLSCVVCKLRKVKCDRNHPCDTCISHGYPSSCSYPEVNIVPSTTKQRNSHRPAPIKTMSKLKNLERLVHLLMSERQQLPPASTRSRQSSLSDNISSLGEHDVSRSDYGRLSIHDTEATYVGSDHWSALIDSIAELKSDLGENNVDSPQIAESNEVATEDNGPALFQGNVRRVSREAILASLPARDVVDGFVSTFFLQREHIPIFLHKVTFMEEYSDFWRHQEEVPIMWIGMLYAIICLGAKFQCTFEESRRPQLSIKQQATEIMVLVQECKVRTVQCLLAGNYMKPVRYCIEALLLYFKIEHLNQNDANFGNWLLVGQIVRIAMRMGLHRDPAHTSQITVFEAEIRRRLWTAIVQIDLTTSYQMGLPNMIRKFQYDTREPLNLLDEDLDQEMTQLPSPRPTSYITPVLYLCTRNRIVHVFAKVLDVTTSVEPTTYSATCDLDNELLDARAAIPHGLQLSSQMAPDKESIDVSMHRIYLDIVYQHARCLLHRKYLVPARTNALFTRSRAICIEAALSLVHHQQTLIHETKPGGPFETRKWKLSSFLDHGLLLGAMVLCVDLNIDLQEQTFDQTSSQCGHKKRIIEALLGAQDILLQSSELSSDARKGATAIGMILGKIGVPSHPMLSDSMASTNDRIRSPSWCVEDFISQYPQGQAWADQREGMEEVFSSAWE